MRIREIHIDGFGRFHDLTLPVPERLGLFLGPNEAGKTTLMAFVRAILFGFEDRRSGRNRYEPFNGGVHGGALVLVDREGRQYRVERTEGRARGDVRVYTPEGHVEGEAAVASLLGGVSPVLYHNVFAFGLEELENLGTLKRDEVSGHIYSAGLGLGAASLVDVMRRLDREMDQLFKKSGQNPEINQLLRELDRLDQEIAKLRREPAEYNHLRERLRALEEEIGAADEEARELEAHARWLDKLDQAWESWQRLVVVRAHLEASPEIDAFPEKGVERLERLEEKLESLERRRETLRSKVTEAREGQTRLPVDDTLLAHGEEILALAEERSYMVRQRQSLPDREAAVRSKEDALAAHFRSLGPGWDEAAVARFDVSVGVREAVRGHKAALEAEKARVQEAEMRLGRARRDRDPRKEETAEAQKAWESFAVPEALTPHPLDERRQALARAEKGRSEVLRLEQELRHARERQGDLTAQVERLRRHEEEEARAAARAATRAPLAKAAPFFSVALGLIAAALLVAAGLPEWGVGAAVAGLGFAAALWGWRALRLRNPDERGRNAGEHTRNAGEHSRHLSERGRELEAQRTTLEQGVAEAGERIRRTEEELARVRASVAEADRMLAGRELAGEEELTEFARPWKKSEAHAEKRRLHEAYRDKQAAVTRAEREVADAQDTFESASESLDRIHRAWRAWLSERGLNPNLTPDGALEVLRTAEQAGEAVRAKEEAAKGLEAAQTAYDEFAGRVAALIDRCGGWAAPEDGAPSRVDDPLAAAERLVKALQTSEENRKEGERLEKEIRELERELEEVEREIKEAREAWRDLLERGGAGDPEAFRTRERIYRERKELHDTRLTLESQLATLAKPDKDRTDLEAALERFDERSLSEAREEAAEASRRAREVLTDKLQEQGSLRQKLSHLETDEALAQKRQEWEIHRAALEERAGRWAVRAVCRHFLDLARERYERERQPAVLKRASEYFATMTRGGFERVVSPLGERDLYVERRGGKRLPTGALSRGTAEQLYLAMRFALVREYAARSLALPIILDDVFVNFDPGRLRAALDVVRDVSEHHQTLMFTCHPHVAQAAREVIPESEPILVEEAGALGEAATASEA